MVKTFSARRVAAVLAVLLLPALVAASASATSYAAVPAVTDSGTTTSVSYDLTVPPDGGAADQTTRQGRESSPSLAGTVTAADGESTATTRQTTSVKHAPAWAGYRLRVIRSVSELSGSATLEGATGGPVVSAATATSLTSFTVHREVTYAFRRVPDTVVQADPGGCTRASVVLKRGSAVVLRRSTHSTACAAEPADIGANSGELAPGDYTLETAVRGRAVATDEYGVGWTADMAGSMTATLAMGRGPICTNVLPRPSGETILGTGADDLLCGAGGPDVLKGFAGNDTLFGQSGDDTLLGGTGRDELRAGDGHDTLSGEDGADKLHPGPHIDDVSAGAGDDVVHGCDNRRDILRGQAGFDHVYRDEFEVTSGFETKSFC